ncbi:MAG: DUF4352 domain-containing protein [Turicibacter sp.]
MAQYKKAWYKKWWIWVIAVVFVASMVGGSSDEEPKLVESNGSVNDKTEQVSGEEAPKTMVFKIGDTIEIKNFKVTVNSVRTSLGKQFMEPEAGNEFFLVDVTVENISTEEQVVSSMMMFNIVDQDGRQMDQAIFADMNGQLDGSISPGRKMTGEYAVEVVAGTTGLELEFNGSFLTGQQVIVELN